MQQLNCLLLSGVLLEGSRRWMCVRSRADHAPPEVEPDAEGCATGRGRRRRQKVAVVARRHGISESVLYNWRSAWKAAASAGERSGAGGICASRRRGRSRRGATAIAGATGSGPIANISGLRRWRWNDRNCVAERCPHLCCWLVSVRLAPRLMRRCAESSRARAARQFGWPVRFHGSSSCTCLTG